MISKDFQNLQWLSSQPNVPRRKSGLLFLSRNELEHEELKRLQILGRANGESVRIIDREELKKLEPDLCLEEINSALLSPEEYVVDPFLLPLSNLVGHFQFKLRVQPQIT
jgi:L-2-hydroxyglutarate oxidase LhgO